ncbi:mycothiol system anti-sigma-R factor [Nesterenkonia sp. F]|uniref:mycothiol system anti-sigma-R factor n=1 Tax=Nesterenkonia sp. F TaxID=795955 RepID=UPI000255D37D|nr:mycothiol system anti-sigma-R factor [Nesterenkonia sp. F]
MSDETTDETCRGGDCRETDERMERIYEYLDGQLSRQDLEDVRTHLHDCPDCATEYDLECIIRSVVRRSCAERAPDTLKVTIMERISQLRGEAGHDVVGRESA